MYLEFRQERERAFKLLFPILTPSVKKEKEVVFLQYVANSTSIFSTKSTDICKGFCIYSSISCFPSYIRSVFDWPVPILGYHKLSDIGCTDHIKRTDEVLDNDILWRNFMTQRKQINRGERWREKTVAKKY